MRRDKTIHWIENRDPMGEESPEKSASDALIHERQSLQLCAIHALNNLLQLSEDSRDMPWRCGSMVVPRTVPQLAVATKSEFDQIADELCVAENDLLAVRQDASEHDSQKEQSRTAGGMSLYDKLTSSHRTILFGNYSYEVLQVAFGNREVELSWFVPDSVTTMLAVNPGERAAGFIVNAKVEEAFGTNGYLQRFPVVSWFFDTGRHWYSISRVSRGESLSTKERTKEWRLLDSGKEEVEYLSDEELFRHLKSVAGEGSAVFRATIQVGSDEKKHPMQNTPNIR